MNRENKFTPGPWKQAGDGSAFVYALNDAGYNRFYLGISAGDIKKAGSKTGIRTSDDELKANANLISSSPELLEELQYLRRFVNPEDVDCGPADAAIAKAYGEKS